jgi:hypothetical protein
VLWCPRLLLLLLQDFLKCLNLYAQEIISRGELINLANVSGCRGAGTAAGVTGGKFAELGGGHKMLLGFLWKTMLLAHNVTCPANHTLKSLCGI